MLLRQQWRLACSISRLHRAADCTNLDLVVSDRLYKLLLQLDICSEHPCAFCFYYFLNAMNLESFQQFFTACVGSWVTERTYHYLSHQEVERSRTEFVIESVPLDRKAQVLTDNQYPVPTNLETLPGYHLEFETVSEKGDRVNQALNMLFVPQQQEGALLMGDYLRDRAYEESRPIVSQFQFNPDNRELLMTTTYTRVVSVDSITLVTPRLRIRKILNYRRPAEGEPLQEVLLVGFGVEQKG